MLPPTRVRSATRSPFSSSFSPRHPLSVVAGDQAVFEAVVAALGLPAGWQKRLVHAFGNPEALAVDARSAGEPAAGAGFR